MVMLRIMLYLGFTLIHSLSHLVAGISLSGPSTDVTVNTTIACQWTAESLEDPETFSLVMQFSDGKTDFGDRALITIIRRGNTTNGTMSNIPNVHDLGPHRLAAYADPFDPTSQPFSVSPSFLVVPSSDAPTSSSDNTVSPIPTSPSSAVPTSSSDNAVSPIPTRLSTSTSSLTSVALRSVSSSDSSLSPSPTSSSSIVIQSLSFPSQSIDVSMASSSSSAKNLNWHLAVIITAILLCAVLAGILILLYLWRRKKQRNLLEVLRPRSFTLTEDRSTYTQPVSRINRGPRISFVSRKSPGRQTQRSNARTSRRTGSELEKTILELEALRAEMLRLTQQQTSPPSYSAV